MVNKITKLHVLIFAIVFASCTGGEERGFPEPIDKSKDVGVKKDVEKTDLSNDVTKKKDQGGNLTDVAMDSTADVIEEFCEPVCSNGEVCKEDTKTCVGCLTETNCSDQLCDLDSNTCVDCLTDTDCSDQLCDLASNTCVDCLDNSTCLSAEASTCTDETCAACVEDTDCSHIADATRCDVGVCKDGCSNDSHCGGNVCDITTNLCTTKNPGEVALCEKDCVSDTDCAVGYDCVPMEHPVGTARGNYCLLRNVLNNCAAPYIET